MEILLFENSFQWQYLGNYARNYLSEDCGDLERNFVLEIFIEA